ncbi:MAG: transporter substrate-binding domain-containing protein, partial [Bacteroidota bacterium]
GMPCGSNAAWVGVGLGEQCCVGESHRSVADGRGNNMHPCETDADTHARKAHARLALGAVGCIANSSTKEFLVERFFTDVRPYDSVLSGLDDLNSHKIEAFLYDEPILQYRLKQDVAYQDLRILPIKFDLQFYAFGLSRNRAVLEERMSQKILEITERMEWQIILNEYGLAAV